MIALSVVKRFWRFVDKDSHPGGCWIWIGSGKDKDGYGYLTIRDSSARSGKRWLKAHRLAWEIHYGKAPTMNVLHRCDNPACVRWSHLFQGSARDNNRDMTLKCRNVFQRNNPSKKLTVSEVFAVKLRRLCGEKLKDLSTVFDVRESTISRIANGVRRGERSWS